jgi:signal transduction histidine kinase
MKTSNEFILLVSLSVTLLMSVLTFISARRGSRKEISHLIEFWASLAFNIVLYYVFRKGTPLQIGCSMLGWVWSLRTFKYVLEDMSLKTVFNRWGFIVLGVGGFISLSLAGYGYPFLFFTVPFAFATGFVGLYAVFSAHKKTYLKSKSPLFMANLVFMGLLMIERLTFPFWRLSSYDEYGFLLGQFAIVGLAVTSLSNFFEQEKSQQSLRSDELMKDKNEKLLGQSKYSELGMMSAGIAHEINNPLAVIQARTTQLLRIYRNPEKQKELADGLQQILYTSERINRTIQGVREFVHQDEKGPQIEISLKDLVDDVLAFCGQRMKNHGVNLRFYGLENFTVVGNKIQLEQILLNLLNNSFDAIEYLPDKWIEVSCHPGEDRVQLFFKDSGQGIPPEVASRMMEPFFSTKDLGKGTGLGLALAKGIAEKHGGSLCYLGNCTHTTFKLELPQIVQPEDFQEPLHH